MRSVSDPRPKPIHTKSFTRMDAVHSSTSPRKRASTLQEAGIPAVPEARDIEGLPDVAGKRTDVFENQEDEEHTVSGGQTPNPELHLPSSFDELPIEIRSLSERFLESLSARVHPAPLTADALSDLFQDFYERAASHIATHIASLSSRIGRDKAPPTPTTSKTSGKGRPRAGSGANRSGSQDSNAGGEMLTASEVADRKKARRLLELKRLALEEAVERSVCEKLYDKIWKHRSTDDDARDEKLRSRTAALSLVGIGLKELHMDSDPKKADVRKVAEEKEDDIHRSLADAREALQRMDDEHHPLGKLQHLTAAHKAIVETLSQIFPSSSSADEILPTLIYTLITSPPEGINVVSNLNFIQRFRTTSKVDGEAAYCLVNLEAAISFLETVDLSSLRADELPEGPPKSNSRPSTPTIEKYAALQQAKPLKPGLSPISVNSSAISSSPDDAAKALPSPRTPTAMSRPPMHQRKLSSLMQQQADRLEAGREGFLSAADKIYDSINGTLDNSFQFVFGRFKEQAVGDSPLPKTLEDARKLVSSPTTTEDDEALLGSGSGRSSPATDDPLTSTSKMNDTKMLELIGGRKPLRDRSVDSARSGGSGKRVAFAAEAAGAKELPKAETPTTAGANLLASINPLNRFQVPSFARFGRTASTKNVLAQPSPTTEQHNKLDDIVESPVSNLCGKDALAFPALEQQRTNDSNVTAVEDLNTKEALAELRKIKPPKKRFLEVQGAGDLKISEIEELLLEYRRLAKAIGEAIAT